MGELYSKFKLRFIVIRWVQPSFLWIYLDAHQTKTIFTDNPMPSTVRSQYSLSDYSTTNTSEFTCTFLVYCRYTAIGLSSLRSRCNMTRFPSRTDFNQNDNTSREFSGSLNRFHRQVSGKLEYASSEQMSFRKSKKDTICLQQLWRCIDIQCGKT